MLEADLQGREQRLRLGVNPDAARPRCEALQDVYFLAQPLPVDGRWGFFRLFSNFIVGQDFVKQIAFDFLTLNELLGELGIV